MSSLQSLLVGIGLALLTGYAVETRSYGMAAVDGLLSAYWLLRAAIAAETNKYERRKEKP